MRTIVALVMITGALSSCGPAGETQAHMEDQARRTSDSIGRWLDSALNDPLKTFAENSYTPVIQPRTTAK